MSEMEDKSNMRIKTIKDKQGKYHLDLSIDEKKNMNFICGDEESRIELYNSIKRNFFLRNESKTVEIEWIEKGHNWFDFICDFVFIDEAEFEHFPAPESKWRQKFDVFFGEILNTMPTDFIDMIVGYLNYELEQEPDTAIKLDVAKINMAGMNVTDYFPLEFIDKVRIIDNKLAYPSNMTYSQKTWLFFAMLFFVRNILHYELPLIIDGHMFGSLISKNSDVESLCEFISDNVQQSLIFISDDVFLNLPQGMTRARIYGGPEAEDSLYNSIKDYDILGAVYQINEDKIEKYVPS